MVGGRWGGRAGVVTDYNPFDYLPAYMYTCAGAGCAHTASIAFRYFPPRLEEGCRKPVLGVWGVLKLQLLVYDILPPGGRKVPESDARSDSTEVENLSSSVCLSSLGCVRVGAHSKPRFNNNNYNKT